MRIGNDLLGQDHIVRSTSLGNEATLIKANKIIKKRADIYDSSKL